MFLKQRGYVKAFSCSTHVVIILLSILKTVASYCPDSDHWSGWWGYDGMLSGPMRWGDHNEDWTICKTGKNQSPINILPNSLLYDPQLQPIKIETALVNGVIRNNKRDLTFLIHNSVEQSVNITSGPLSYTYKLYQIKLHYGRLNSTGSEHRIDGKSFAGEFLAYNSELYTNFSEAQMNPRGIAIIAVFLSIGTTGNSAFEMFREKFVLVDEQDSCTELHELPIEKLLPRTELYMTYSGSLTQPGCRETVTWILLNKPIYISYHQMDDLRKIPYQEWRYSNARPVMPLNHRTVRTNINFRKRTRLCSMEISKKYEDTNTLIVKLKGKNGTYRLKSRCGAEIVEYTESITNEMPKTYSINYKLSIFEQRCSSSQMPLLSTVYANVLLKQLNSHLSKLR